MAYDVPTATMSQFMIDGYGNRYIAAAAETMARMTAKGYTKKQVSPITRAVLLVLGWKRSSEK